MSKQFNKPFAASPTPAEKNPFNPWLFKPRFGYEFYMGILNGSLESLNKPIKPEDCGDLLAQYETSFNHFQGLLKLKESCKNDPTKFNDKEKMAALEIAIARLETVLIRTAEKAKPHKEYLMDQRRKIEANYESSTAQWNRKMKAIEDKIEKAGFFKKRTLKKEQKVMKAAHEAAGKRKNESLEVIDQEISRNGDILRTTNKLMVGIIEDTKPVRPLDIIRADLEKHGEEVDKIRKYYNQKIIFLQGTKENKEQISQLISEKEQRINSIKANIKTLEQELERAQTQAPTKPTYAAEAAAIARARQQEPATPPKPVVVEQPKQAAGTSQQAAVAPPSIPPKPPVHSAVAPPRPQRPHQDAVQALQTASVAMKKTPATAGQQTAVPAETVKSPQQEQVSQVSQVSQKPLVTPKNEQVPIPSVKDRIRDLKTRSADAAKNNPGAAKPVIISHSGGESFRELRAKLESTFAAKKSNDDPARHGPKPHKH